MITDSERVKRYGIYRGIVVDNNDPGITLPGNDGKTETNDDIKTKPFGRCRIFFPGIYPAKYETGEFENLPWAEPVYPIFGGNTATKFQIERDEKNKDNPPIKNYSNSFVGWSSVPHVGAMVWGFFEDGNIQYPKFFGTTQTGLMYLAEHKNQHIISTDNVKIIIDEEPENENSTNRFDSENKESTSTVKAFKTMANLEREQMPTRVNITVIAKPPNNSKLEEKYDEKKPSDNPYCAINLKIIGNVNSHIEGDVYETHIGDKFEYQKGNLYRKIEGDIEIEHKGYIKETHSGNDPNSTTRDFLIQNGNNVELYANNHETTISGLKKLTISKSNTEEVAGQISIKSDADVNIKGSVINLN